MFCSVPGSLLFDTHEIEFFQVTLSESLNLVGSNIIDQRPKEFICERRVLHMDC